MATCLYYWVEKMKNEQKNKFNYALRGFLDGCRSALIDRRYLLNKNAFSTIFLSALTGLIIASMMYLLPSIITPSLPVTLAIGGMVSIVIGLIARTLFNGIQLAYNYVKNADKFEINNPSNKDITFKNNLRAKSQHHYEIPTIATQITVGCITGLGLAFGFSAPWLPLLYSFGCGMIGMLVAVMPVTFAQAWKKPFKNVETRTKSENALGEGYKTARRSSLGAVNNRDLVTSTGKGEDFGDDAKDDEQQGLSQSDASDPVMDPIPDDGQPKRSSPFAPD